MSALSNRSWLVPCALVVAIEYLLAPLTGPFSAVRLKTYALAGATIGITVMVAVLLVRLARMARAGEPAPLRAIRVGFPWSVLIAAMLVMLQVAALNLTKHMLPLTVGFFADPALAAFDRMMLGTDAWRLSYALFGWATPALDFAYITWAPVKALVLLLVVLAPASATKARAMIAYFLCFAVGCFGQYLGASAGPIFYGPLGLGDDFRDLPLMPWAQQARDYLLVDMMQGHRALGAGISAMPSLHVTLALWVALVVRAMAPRVQLLGWLFFVTVTIGSVHLGWHYASDAIVGWIIALAAWQVAPLLARASDRWWHRRVAARSAAEQPSPA